MLVVAVGSDELHEAEHGLLLALQQEDPAVLATFLADDFLIVTAGWIAEPADKPTWLDGLAQHDLDVDLRLLAVRRYEDVAVVLAESAQKGTRSGRPGQYTFRYTDAWRRVDAAWLLAVRHASIVSPA